MGGERRRVACAQLRPREHARHDPDSDQRSDRLDAEGEMALRPEGRQRLWRLRLGADRPQRHRLFPGPELERLCARPLHRQARVEAHVQQAERRPEWHRLWLRPHLRRDGDGRLCARSADREAGLGAQADPQQQRGHRHDAPALRQHRRLQHGAGQRLVLLRRQRRRDRLGTGRRHGSSSPSPTRLRCTARPSSRMGRAGPAPISTRTRSSPSTARQASSSGSGRRFRTTSATTT